MDTHERLRQLLNERGWSEYKLAKRCGLSESTVANILGEIQSPPSQHWKQSVVVWHHYVTVLPRGT